MVLVGTGEQGVVGGGFGRGVATSHRSRGANRVVLGAGSHCVR